MSFQPRIFTFYSYKGGVGRSMALLNMAYYLQARGRHVLIVDLDLEAPGASGFLHRSEELLPYEGTGDVVDVLKKVVDAVKQAPAGIEPQLPDLQLKDYLRSVDPKKFATALHPKAPPARLDVLGAEQGQDYTARFSALELPSLSAEQIGDASDLLRGLLIQHSFPFPQPWQEEGAAPEPTHYDYILVDSRTGLSEIGGLCIGPLSDRLIVLCGLNDQNIEGTRQFMKVVGLKPEVRPADAEAFDDADLPAEDGQRPATLGPKPTLLVASPVPGAEMAYKKQRMQVLEKQLGMTPVKLSYHPHMALMETLFIRDHADEYLALEYATLAERMMSMVGDTVSQLTAPIYRMLGSRSERQYAKSLDTVVNNKHKQTDSFHRLLPLRPSKKKEKLDFVDIVQRLARSARADGQAEFGFLSFEIKNLGLPEDASDQLWRLKINLAPTDEIAVERWLDWADSMDTAEAREKDDTSVLQSMEDKYRKAVTLKPQFYKSFSNWGTALLQWALNQNRAKAVDFLVLACEKFKQSEAIQTDDYQTLCNWGIALSQLANNKSGAEADVLFTQAYEKYQRAEGLQPDNSSLHYNWGILLTDWAKAKEGADADALFAQACEKYHRAANLEVDAHSTLINWGIVLGDWAKTKKAAEADALFSQACEKFQQAATIQPLDHAALLSWGTTLWDWAKIKKAAEADALFSQACEKFQQAAAIQPLEHATILSWGIALSDWAKIKDSAETDALYAQACEKFQRAAAIDKNDILTLSNWGYALSSWAKTKEAAGADALFALACEKLQQAAALQPTEQSTLHIWGIALSNWAKTKTTAHADALFAQAGEKLQQVIDLQPNDHEALFDLGCVAALRGKAQEAVTALEKWKSVHPSANKAELDADTDFDLIRNDPRFQALRDGLAG
jgi:tetratricopeptide (TPR) repeat protein